MTWAATSPCLASTRIAAWTKSHTWRKGTQRERRPAGTGRRDVATERHVATRCIPRFVPFHNRKGRLNVGAYPYLPLFTQDFIADTTHLDAQETGAYLMLLMVAWQSPQCRLPDNDRKLAAWARVDSETWRTIKPEVLAFWTLKSGYWTQGRLLEEWQRTLQLRDKQRANAMRRWHSHGNATAMPRHSQSNAPIPGEEPSRDKDSLRSLDTLGAAGADATIGSLDDVWGAAE